MANKNPKRNTQWFYVILVLMVVGGYVIVSYAIAATSTCTGHRAWEWKFPPGFTCQTGPRL